MSTPIPSETILEPYWEHGIDCACLQIRSPVSGLPGRERQRRVFVMVQVVIDDSNRGQEDAPAFILAGWMAPVNNWARFREAWDTELKKEPSISLLKSNEALNFRNNFGGYTETERDDRLLGFVNVINQTAFASVRLALVKSEFHRILKASKGSLQKMYALPTAAIVTRTLYFAFERKMRQTVEFIFDTGIMTPNQLAQMEREAREGLPSKAARKLKRFRHDTDDKFYPLQAADLFVGYVREDLIAKAEGHEFQSRVWTALNKKPCVEVDLSKESLEDLRRRMERTYGPPA
ncbi:MAG: DUF3800 domain-containing protein [Candidatus Binatus sp.]|jgi:hypothetical protein|uniref:DUF3800 domain-containing protein n=1 Tax=Candidatus Binatus sp. TaxID=2811406 RepID=UPI003D0DFA1A